jgi:hypothetical protein
MIVAGGCVHKPARLVAATISTSDPATVPAPICTDSMAPLRDRTEAGMLARSAGRVRRDHCRLIFRTVGGDTAVFANDQSDNDRAISYTYLGPAGDQLDLVRVGYYEGGSYMLVERDGVHVAVAGPPTFSPDGSRFASLSMDLEAEYDPNVVQVWRLNRGHPRLEIAITSDEWGPSDALWVGADTLRFTQNFPTDSIGVYRKQHAELIRNERGWTFQARL